MKKFSSKTYRIDELAKKKKDSNFFLFDPKLTQEIENTFILPFVNQSLQDFLPSPLLSYEDAVAKKRAEGWEHIQKYAKKIEDGLLALQKANIWVDPNISLLNLKIQAEEKLPQKALNIADEVMDLSYEEACTQYRNRDYVKSGNILEVLLYLNPTRSIYWQLFGMVEHELGHLEPAIENLAIGLQKGSLSLIPYVHLISCLVELKRYTEAKNFIDLALKIEHPTDIDPLTIQEALRNLDQTLKEK